MDPRDFEGFDGYRRRIETIGKQFAAVNTVAPVLENYRQTEALRKQFAEAIGKQYAAVNTKHLAATINSLVPILDSYQRGFETIGKQYAAAVNTKAIAEMFGAVNAKSPMFDGYRYTEAIGKQFAALNVNSKAIAETLGTVNALSPVLQSYRETAAIAMRLAAVTAPVWALPEGSSRSEVATTVPSVNWLLLGQYTLRVLFAAMILAMICAAWQEQKESAPALTLLEIFSALWLWNEIDEAIWKRLS